MRQVYGGIAFDEIMPVIMLASFFFRGTFF